MVAPADTTADAHGAEHKHPWHLVDPSPWPVVGALSAGVLAVGTVIYMHDGGSWLMALGFLGVAATMFETLADRGINIQEISTSEIKISVLIEAAYTELAVRSLHTAYGLDSK